MCSLSLVISASSSLLHSCVRLCFCSHGVSPEAYIPPQIFYNGKVDYFDLQRLGGLLSHLKKTLKGQCGVQ